MYCKHLILIFFLIASLKCLAQESVRLNIKLYPIQTISVPSNISNALAENKTSVVSEAKYIKVSSLSGFQVKIRQQLYNAEKKVFTEQNDDTMEYALIDKRKGGIDEKIAIDNNFLSGGSVKNINLDSKFIYHTLVYTIISQ
ncbi:hypothetical protein PFY12_05345 [Chryseobacterium camelliae]|uniref:DUF4138 domain-containing protein n=1 Tax=Chryseobacterium camelliae TaxID=1265445 RepID=A0ABY7QPF4_9FLAO|nr:hypothetical protein [Chryseobacterium camelliae]WBV61548.1 hypothetical protein PFY12_05345 [Chryseobacterium camelliae]